VRAMAKEKGVTFWPIFEVRVVFEFRV